MNDKIIEQCSKCNNTVVGEFTPSKTREWLTALAKKGGMKAVLTAAGSVIPGFGNISGLLAGTAIDLIYGKNINELVDYVADLFDDNKIYVFTCPNCGHTWNRKEDEAKFTDSYSETYSEFSSSSSRNSRTKVFQKKFKDFLERLDTAVKDTVATDTLSREMERIANNIGYSDSTIASQYLFLAGLCDLLYAKKRYPDTNSRKQLKRAKKNLKAAVDLLSDDEYKLMLAAANTLLCTTPQQCIIEGTLDTSGFKFENGTLFKEDWLIEIYEECRFLSIVNADKVINTTEDGKYDDKCMLGLWKPGQKFKDKDYRMISNLKVAIHCSDREEGEKFGIEEADALNAVVNTQGYCIENCDVNSFYDRGWLEGCVYLAQSIVENENPYVDKDIKDQLTILERISDFVECFAGFLACITLGRYYEEGVVVEKNISKALRFYKKAGSEEDIVRLMTVSNTSDRTVSSGTSYSLSDSEAEYLEELKECLENGEISKGERRLLEKLRIKLGITEDRAADLEQLCLTPKLTEEEQEYLVEYKECLAAGGAIFAGERRLLNRLRDKLGISEERANELENL